MPHFRQRFQGKGGHEIPKKEPAQMVAYILKVDDKLVKAFVNFLMEVYEDTYEIVEHLDTY